MEIKLSDAQISALLSEVTEKLKKDALAMGRQQLETYMRSGQFIGEIRNIVASEVAAELREQALHKINMSKALDKAVQAAEQRANAAIHKALTNGIIVKFDGLA